jgi:glucosamine 6-phosphate synthetase-like amidotransferase/phosphosugar isomerase protein
MEFTKKSNSLREGDIVNISGRKYKVEKISEKNKNKGEKSLISKEILLDKSDEKGKGRIMGRYIFMKDRKTGEQKFYRESEEKESSGRGFSWTSKKIFFSKTCFAGGDKDE